MANQTAHGKEELRWCDACGTLLLGDSCSVCGSGGRQFRINSPGDIRPCMGDSVDMVLALFREAFGTDAPLRGRAMFLNKIPGEDRADEIVAHGAVVAVMRYDIRRACMVLELRQHGAELFAPVAKRSIVRFAGMSGHLKGKVVPGANVTEVVGTFSEGDPLILLKGGKVGPGVSLCDSGSLRGAERAVKIRDLNAPSGIPASPKAGLDTFVACNKGHVRRIQRRAVHEIRRFMDEGNRNRLPVTVSFSGGKDSLAACALAMEACGSVDLINIDTGLEFPETLEYVDRFARMNGLRLHRAVGGTGFSDNIDTFGPPAKDFRWCCKVCKLGPVTDTIDRDFPRGTVTVEGNRRLESFARSKTSFVTRNPFVPNQINLNPIRDWSAAEVWLYILTHGLDYNPLYDRQGLREDRVLSMPRLPGERVDEHAQDPSGARIRVGFLPRILRGIQGPPGGVCVHGVLEVEGPSAEDGPHRGRDGPRPQAEGAARSVHEDAEGRIAVEAIVNVPRQRDFSYVEDALRTVGDAKYDDAYEIALLRLPIGRARLFGGGQVSVNSPDARNAKEVFSRAVTALVRAMMCTECGICAKGCPRRAITMDGGMRVDPGRCNSCGRCERSCMVVHYSDRLLSEDAGASPATINRP